MSICLLWENPRTRVVNAWAYPDFRKAVLATGRKNLIMAGVTTDVCLIFPSIDAALEALPFRP